MSEVSYRPLIEDMTFSYSRLTCFEDCRYRWFLKYIHGARDEPLFYSSFGSFMHSLIQRYYMGLIAKDDLPRVFLEEFTSSVQGKRPPGETVSKYIHDGLSYFRAFEPFPFSPVATERRLSFEVNGLKFVGFLDFLGEKDGEYYIVDHKSHNLKPRSKRSKPTQNDLEIGRMLRQLYLYAEGVRQAFGKYPKALCFNCFRSNTFITEPFDRQAHQSAISWATALAASIMDESDFPPTIDFFPCTYLCPVSHTCEYFPSK